MDDLGREATVRLLAVGDMCIDRDDPETAFEFSLGAIRGGDILFGNCEAVYAENAHRAPSASIPVLCSPRHALGLGYAGFDVMSLANNHVVDGGHEGMFETMERLQQQGIAVCGAGENEIAARAPVVVERNGLRVAFLAYTCIYPAGYEARDGVPGIAAIRTHRVYTPSAMDSYQSGGMPDQFTVVNPADLRRFSAEIEAARLDSDVVVVSMHAGDGSVPAILTDYERQLARSAIDAGADVYLGHHHHMLRGADIYRGRPIFYGLGHFVFDIPDLNGQVPPSIMANMLAYAGEYGYGDREGYPLLPMHPEARMIMIAVIDVSSDGVVSAGVVPGRLNPAGQPVPLSAHSEEGQAVIRYLESLNERGGLSARWSIGDQTLEGFPVVQVLPPEPADELATSRQARR